MMYLHWQIKCTIQTKHQRKLQEVNNHVLYNSDRIFFISCVNIGLLKDVKQVLYYILNMVINSVYYILVHITNVTRFFIG